MCIKKTGFTEKFATKGKNTGKDNPFFGKKHTEESKRKITENKDFSSYKTQEFRDKISKISSGENNSMYGKRVYDVWLEKYGKEIADQKKQSWKKSISNNTKGIKSHRYGKPAPKKSGNGWSGWYKEMFFRSLIELSFMIFMEKNNFDFVSAVLQADRHLFSQYATEVLATIKAERSSRILEAELMRRTISQSCRYAPAEKNEGPQP